MTSPSLLDRMERRFGHLALPGFLRIIASFQAICFILIYINPEFASALVLSPAAWENGEVWRFITFTFIPSSNSLIFIIFVLWLLFIVGDQLEAEWGKFRLNLFFLSTMVCLWIITCSFPSLWGILIGGMAGTILYSSLFFAFATVAPNYTFLIFMILPVPAKWLALLDAAGLLHMLFMAKPMVYVPMEIRLALLLGFLPYACFALPIAWRRLRHGARVSTRRAAWKSNSLPVGPAFHECRICHRTDQTDPTLEFRIASDDEEYCIDHLP